MNRTGTAQFVSFDLDGRLCGFDIRIVKEVNPNVRLTPVPRAARHLRGLVNIRGQVVLVIDIAVLFGKPPRPIGPTSQIVILKTAQEIQHNRNLASSFQAHQFSDKSVGFLVDAIGDVVSVAADEMSPPPPHLKESLANLVVGVVRVPPRLLIVLNAVDMLASSGGARSST